MLTYEQKMAIEARVSVMTDEQKEARVEEIYAIPDDECSTDLCYEFFVIMLGGGGQAGA